MAVSERSQIFIVWWAVAFATIFGLALGFLLHMLPPPGADIPADELKRWYQENAAEIRIGATLASVGSGFMVPLWAVLGLQISRLEKGRPIWSVMAVAGGAMASVWLAVPGICFGVAAFSPDRDASATQIMHELGIITLITTTQYYLYCFVALIVFCLLPRTAKYSPFPRWFGYFNIWFVALAEVAVLAYNFKTGPFAWNGLFAFWIPFGIFGVWLAIIVYLLLKALHQQSREAEAATTGQLSDVPSGR